MSKKIVCLMLVALLVVTSAGIAVYAGQPDITYTYDGSTAVPSTNVYQVKKIVDESVMGTTRLNQPTDIFVDKNQRIFVLDAGNSRILILNEEYKCIKEIKDFVYNGEVTNIATDAKGLFYREANQSLYIADTGNNRIVVSDLDGNVSKIYEKPVDELLDPEAQYMPKKIIVDNMGIMYVSSGTVNTGAMMVDSANNFLGFYGTNKLKLTAAMQLEFFWRSILSDEQNANSDTTFQPVEYYNLFWSDDRFIYAVSPVMDSLESTVVKLNALGNNVFSENIDFVEIGNNSNVDNMQLADITVDTEGAFTVLDQITGRLFHYDENCNLLAIFGGMGYQKGLFTLPVSIESDDDNNLLVLDSTKSTITVMEQTYYGQMIRVANRLYNEGRYQESIEPWMDVLRMNANYTQAYMGLGKAYIGMGEYEKAMDYFMMGQDKTGYAEAKAALRDEIVREYFGLIAVVVIIVLISILFSEQLTEMYYKTLKLFARKRGAK